MKDSFVVFVKVVVVVVVETEVLPTVQLVGGVVEPGVAPLGARVRARGGQAVVVVLVVDALQVVRI